MELLPLLLTRLASMVWRSAFVVILGTAAQAHLCLRYSQGKEWSA